MDTEKLDYYRCPLDHFYLTRGSNAPWGAIIADGIEIRGIAPFGIQANVSALFNADGPDGIGPTGNAQGTVSNWNTDARDYGVTLHCTNDIGQSYRGNSGLGL